MTKLYLITYSFNPNFNSVNFHNYIKALFTKKWISDWWHYTDSAYIVVSSQTVQNLYNAAVPGMIGIKHILITEINPNNQQGWLPKDAWGWMQKYRT